MLEWPGPPRESTGYMELSSFKERRVLPDPLEIDKSDRDLSVLEYFQENGIVNYLIEKEDGKRIKIRDKSNYG